MTRFGAIPAKWGGGQKAMCGICGLFDASGAEVTPATVAAMTRAMVHRGPDDEGLFSAGRVALGFRRLSILDLEHGHQPMANEDASVWSVVNGEIYNAPELRAELLAKGHRLQSLSDSEVVPHLFEEHGIGLVHRLRGMFALAVYDRRREELFLARDPFGIKPLYYVQRDGRFAFASEVKALIASGLVTPRVDLEAAWDYFTFQYVPEPRTMFEGIAKVPAAHYVRVGRAGTMSHRYWSIEFTPEDRPLEHLEAEIQAEITGSVAAHLLSDVPVGVYLSSGLDSGLIATLMARAGGSPHTFSIGFSGQPHERDELRHARALAAALGSEHHELSVSEDEYREELPTIVAMQEDPVADPSAPALFFLSRLASAHVRVVLSGEGADELFGGYPIYGEPRALRPFRYLPAGARQALRAYAQGLPAGLRGRSFLERGTTPIEQRFLGNAKIFSEAEKHLLFGGHTLGRPSTERTAAIYRDTAHLDDITRMQAVDCTFWLPGDILAKADKMGMAHSVEVRVPFLDREVFRVAARLPSRYKVARGTTKFALREAFREILPAPLATRPKLGFPVPARSWLRGGLKDFAFDVIASTDTGFIDRGYAKGLLTEHTRGLANHERRLWTILVFLLWYRAFVASR